MATDATVTQQSKLRKEPVPYQPLAALEDHAVPPDTPGAREAEAAAGDRTPDKLRFASGATRSADVAGLRYDLISPVGLRRLAARYGLGSAQHGDRNWEGGIPASETFNHVLAHLYRWVGGDRADDHLAAAAWGCFALMHYEEQKPEMIDTPKLKEASDD